METTDLLNLIPPDIFKFILVTLFSLLIGLEQRRIHIDDEKGSLFGTDRTFTLIGILGFLLYVISPDNIIPFITGGVIIAVLMSIFYYQKIQIHHKFGLTGLVTALITYCLTPLVYTQHASLIILVVVVVLVITEIKGTLFKFTQNIDNDEFITLAKFLVVAGVILPMLPDKSLFTAVYISPYKLWLAVVAVSGISYVSYLLQKFVFPDSGIVLTGILGGLYSSTATTIILARKSKELTQANKVSAAIMLATALMYLRIFLLALVFNKEIAFKLIPSFSIFIIISVLLAVYFLKFLHKKDQQQESVIIKHSHGNPLEFKTAMVFAALFIFFGLITGFINNNYGSGGINVLSFVVGVTDIDPFILSLFQGKMNIEIAILVMAVLNAITSNNLLKMIYGLSFGSKSIRYPLIAGFGTLVVLGLLMSFVIHF